MAGIRYVADPEDSVLTVALDGLCALYHEPSGMTHIVAAPAPEILGALREGPADAQELLRRLSERFAFEGEEAQAAIHVRLGELEEAGLVRRA